MLQYKKGRFHCKGVSFEIPENFFLDTYCDITYENGLELISPNEKMVVEYNICDFDGSTEEELQKLLRGDSFVVIEPITPVLINGLVGHQCSYRTSSENYFEVHLKITDELEIIYCLHSSECDVRKEFEKPEIKRTLMEIRKD